MKELKTIQDLRHFVFRFDELRKLSRQTHSLNEASCNYGLTPRQEKRELKLQVKCKEIANEFNLDCYFQGDPRGCALYLVEQGSNRDSDYTNGIAVY